MNDAQDDFSITPTELDLERLRGLAVDHNVVSENGVWTVIRYPVSREKAKCWKWCAFSLIVNCPGLPVRGGTYELKNLPALLSFMRQLEGERRKARSG